MACLHLSSELPPGLFKQGIHLLKADSHVRVCVQGMAKPLQQEGVYIKTTAGHWQKQGAAAQ